MKKTFCIMVFAGLGFSLAAAPLECAEVLKIVRERVLAVDGVVVKLEPPRSIAAGKGPGQIAEADVTQSGAPALQLHFQILTAPLDSSWTMQVFDQQDDLVWSYTPAPGGPREVWSEEVPGDTAKVVVRSTRANQPFSISVDRTLVARSGVVPRSVTPPETLENIASQPNEIKDIGKATARLRFISDDGKRYVCTGFLIAADLFITNEHCPETDSEWHSSTVDFDFDSASAKPKTLHFRERLAVERDLDFAIYRLESKLSDRQPLKLLAAAPVEGASLIIIQHPGGKPKQVSISDCRVEGASMEGVSRNKTDFGHRCDTLGGSSGSGVMASGSKQIVGLHHLGYIDGIDQPVNRAVKMSLILQRIAERYPNLKLELGL